MLNIKYHYDFFSKMMSACLLDVLIKGIHSVTTLDQHAPLSSGLKSVLAWSALWIKIYTCKQLGLEEITLRQR